MRVSSSTSCMHFPGLPPEAMSIHGQSHDRVTCGYRKDHPTVQKTSVLYINCCASAVHSRMNQTVSSAQPSLTAQLSRLPLMCMCRGGYPLLLWHPVPKALIAFCNNGLCSVRNARNRGPQTVAARPLPDRLVREPGS